ncbi:thioredoxin family protein [Paenisporosarcina antarctica]|uniref:Thioredoxin n=1 Tax=Paenisporosarcina antarctica TaxID=417367 RepID=A0A4P6ZX66_9BACL|nr:thioredoxin family protein [Paenisporosarcina antarctica]QBP41031.1 thioredoxin [Paenisporosarcina antarctica]
MKSITTYEQWQEISQHKKHLLLFVKTTNCSVCEGLYPQIKVLENDTSVPFYVANIAEIPELAGQLSLFTAPVVILMREGKEFARYARFVPVQDVSKKLQELIKWEE